MRTPIDATSASARDTFLLSLSSSFLSRSSERVFPASWTSGKRHSKAPFFTRVSGSSEELLNWSETSPRSNHSSSLKARSSRAAIPHGAPSANIPAIFGAASSGDMRTLSFIEWTPKLPGDPRSTGRATPDAASTPGAH